MNANLIRSMLKAHLLGDVDQLEIIASALNALGLCEQITLACADACLWEKEMDHLRACIQLDLDCAAVCNATVRLLTRRGEPAGSALHAQLHACVVACQACADECFRHAEHHSHCAICAETCRVCQEKCNAALAELSGAGVASSE